MDQNGKEDRTEASQDFVVYPEQLTLEPGQKRNVRVTWTGDSGPTSELAFRLIASQLPVQLEKPTNRADVKVNLKFVLQYVASLYVTPQGAKPDVKVDSVKVPKDGHAELILKNEGKMHKVLESFTLKLKAGDREIPVPESTLKEMRSQNILAGSSRTFRILVPNGTKTITADFHLD